MHALDVTPVCDSPNNIVVSTNKENTDAFDKPEFNTLHESAENDKQVDAHLVRTGWIKIKTFTMSPHTIQENSVKSKIKEKFARASRSCCPRVRQKIVKQQKIIQKEEHWFVYL